MVQLLAMLGLQAWLQVQRLTRTGQHALFFWSDDELELLEEERLVDMAKAWRHPEP